MKQLNDENIDELMFMLLEGEIQGEERTALLEAIHADTEYSKIWAAWQNTVVSPSSDLPDINIQNLKRKSKTVFAVHIRKYAVAAAIILAGFLTVFLINRSQSDVLDVAGTESNKPNKPTLQLPQPSDKITRNPLLPNLDTIVTKSQIIKSMASKKSNIQGIENDIEIIENKNAPNNPNSDFELEKIVKHEIQQDEKSENPVIPAQTSPQNEILVSVETTKLANNYKVQQEEQTWLKRLFGSSKIKIENDTNTRTNRKLVIENKKYQIIAGF